MRVIKVQVTQDTPSDYLRNHRKFRAWFDDDKSLIMIGSDEGPREIFRIIETWMSENCPEEPVYEILIIDSTP